MAPDPAISSTSVDATANNHRKNLPIQPPPQLRRRISSLPFLQLARRFMTSARLHPLLTPRVTFARWRAQRAMRAAARAARDRQQLRDWQDNFYLNGLTWHHLYISQDLRRIVAFTRELHKHMQPSTAPHPSAVTAPRRALSPQAQGALLVRLERAYAFLLDNVCDVYNSLEKHVLFPWVTTGTSSVIGTKDPNKDNVAALNRALTLFSKERDRIEDHADRLQARFARLVCATGHPNASTGPCDSPSTFSATRARRNKRRREAADARSRADALKNGGGEGDADEIARRRRSSMVIRHGFVPPATTQRAMEAEKAREKSAKAPTVLMEVDGRGTKWRGVQPEDVAQVGAELQAMIEDTEQLHQTERALLYPLISKSFSEREQLRLTHVMVYSMRSALAKFIITIYHQAVEKNGTRSQWRWYKREVPLPIRVYTPVWRARLYDGCPLGWLRQTDVKGVGRGELGGPWTED